MSNWLAFAIFFSTITGLYGGAHYYIYKWFVRLAAPPFSWRRVVFGLFIFMVASFPVARVLSGYGFNAFSYLLTLISSVWMGLALYFFLCALGCNLILGILKLLPIDPQIFGSHPIFYQRILFMSIIVAVFLIGGWALREASNIRVTRLEIPLRGLPPEMDGMTLVQASDIHYGMLVTSDRLAKIVEQINALQPDMVVITGDLVDEGVDHMEEMAIPLSRIQSRQGVFAITGNHEFYAGVQRAVAIMQGAKIKVLRNELVVLPSGLQILGMEDPTAYRMGEPKPDFSRLFARLNPQAPAILLYHQPLMLAPADSTKWGLQLSGHTHGGQLFPIRYISRLFYPYGPGLHSLAEGFLYVSWGAGTWGPPMRLMAPPELVCIRLRSPRA